MTQKRLSAFVTIVSLSGLAACGAGSGGSGTEARSGSTALREGAAMGSSQIQGCPNVASQLSGWSESRYETACKKPFRRLSSSGASTVPSGVGASTALLLQEAGDPLNARRHKDFCAVMLALAGKSTAEKNAQAKKQFPNITASEATSALSCPAELRVRDSGVSSGSRLVQLSVDLHGNNECTSSDSTCRGQDRDAW